jgi:hypothetical protein
MQRVLYIEHHRRSTIQKFADGKAIKARYADGTTIDYTKPQPNAAGRVQFSYIPRTREGNFYGPSMVPDVAGLATEFNSRAADEGDAMRRTAQQRFVGSNITSEPRIRKILDKDGNSVMEFYDVGVTNPALDDPPELKPLDPPDWKESYSGHKDFLWTQLQREAGMGPIAFGEDEGSQRSALTLAFRMWPSTVAAKAQRTFWNDGLNQVNKIVLDIAYNRRLMVQSQVVPVDYARQYDLSPDWLPMLPRDREALTNEIILRLQQNAIPMSQALEMFGDIPDVQEAVKEIQDWMKFMAETTASAKPQEQDISKPVASTSLKE